MSTADATGRAVSAENISPIAATTAMTMTSTRSERRIAPTPIPPAAHAHARNGNAVARKTSEITQDARSLPRTSSHEVMSVVCSVARTPCSLSPLTVVAVRLGTTSMPSMRTKNVVTS